MPGFPDLLERPRNSVDPAKRSKRRSSGWASISTGPPLNTGSAYTGAAGCFCTITSSNLDPVGSKVGNGNWAVGCCTLGVTFSGICRFSDVAGELTGFHARVDVSPFPNDVVNYAWRGTYSFTEPGR